MGTRYFALILGIIYIVVAVAGFIPPLLTPVTGGPAVSITTLYGNLLGLFPVNLLHTLVHLIIGVWGVMAFRSFSGARSYSKVVGILFIILTVMGLIPGLNTLFGLVPLFGLDVLLHAVTAVAGLYFGFVAPAEEPTIAGTQM